MNAAYSTMSTSPDRKLRVLTTSKGLRVETTLTDQEAFLRLAALAATGDRFAADLRRAYTGRYGWSPSQQAWAHKLALDTRRLEEQAAEKARSILASPPPSQDLATSSDLPSLFGIEIEGHLEVARPAPPQVPAHGPYLPVVELLAHAAEKLKWPKLRLQGPEGEPLVIAICGRQSSRPGTLRLTDGEPYGLSQYYGWIGLDGSWHPAGDCPAWLAPLLDALVADPAAVAALHGKKCGRCSFCGLELTDPRSVSVGYGPICAEKWGLPWGA